MNNIFLISGMMRSGTCFASTLINLCPNAYCSHEDEQNHKGGTMFQYMLGRPEKFVGDAAPTNKNERLDGYNCKRVAISRPIDEVVRSCTHAFHGLIPVEFYLEDASRFADWVDIHNPLIVPFKDLFTVAGANRIWEYLLPGETFPEDKVALLIKNRIMQVLPSKQQMLRDIENFTH